MGNQKQTLLNRAMKKKPAKHVPFYKKKAFLWTIGVIVGVVLIILLAFRFSPWPGAMIIRAVFSQNDAKMTEALQKHTPSVPIDVVSNQKYRDNDGDALFDVYYPESVKNTDKKLPVVIWTHGGAWVSGGKEDNAPYFKLLAAEGYTVISVDYTRGPEGIYPTAVQQLNDAHEYIKKNAARYHVDANQVFLAGDSAGSQLSSQMAAIITNPAYASDMQVHPSFNPEEIKGVLLNCGIYQMDGLVQPDPNLPKVVGWGTDVSVWAYTGSRDFSNPALKQMSAHYHVTADFPTTYITGGNGDPLTKAQSKPLADKLKSLGVDVTELFYADDHQPSLPHEYQFNLDNDDGKNALKSTTSFLKKHSQAE